MNKHLINHKSNTILPILQMFFHIGGIFFERKVVHPQLIRPKAMNTSVHWTMMG